MTKIEVIYEKLAADAVNWSDNVVMKEFLKRVSILELEERMPIFDRDGDYPQSLKGSIADVMYFLLMIASKHGACLECLADIMEHKFELFQTIGERIKKSNINMIVPQPKVTNINNTGPEIK